MSNDPSPLDNWLLNLVLLIIASFIGWQLWRLFEWLL